MIDKDQPSKWLGPTVYVILNPFFQIFYFLKTKMDASVKPKNILHNKCIIAISVLQQESRNFHSKKFFWTQAIGI